MKLETNVYSIALHVALVGLCAVTVLLALENRTLRRQIEPPPAGPAEGQRVEPIRLRLLDGGETTLDPASGERDSLLLVFTTDCPACREMQDDWRRLHRDLGDRLDVVGISLSGVEATRRYRDELSLPFQVGLPSEPQRLIETLSVSGVPMTIRVGPDGRVRGSWSGTLSADQLSEVARFQHG